MVQSPALSTWQQFSLSVELLSAEVDQAKACLEREDVQEALSLLTSAHQQISEGLELEEDQPNFEQYSALAEDLQGKVPPSSAAAQLGAVPHNVKVYRT